jgi:RNA polymerase sigma factor (sigma-70 family)
LAFNLYKSDEAMSGNDHCQPNEGTHARFPSQTQWTLLIQPAADLASPEARGALNLLCQTYWFPVYAFLRSERIDSHRAKDLTQGFFLHLLEDNLIRQAHREKGRFRTFLLACLRNYLKDEWRKEQALKRGGQAEILSIDDTEAEEKYQRLPVTEPASEATFDRTWAATVIERATERLRLDYARRGRSDVFEVMKGCLTGEVLPDSYAGLSAKLGMTRETFEVNLTRLRKAFGQAARHVVAESVAPSQINEEIKYLVAAWSAYLTAKP